MVNIATILEIGELRKKKCGKSNHLHRFKRVIRENGREKQSNYEIRNDAVCYLLSIML